MPCCSWNIPGMPLGKAFVSIQYTVYLFQGSHASPPVRMKCRTPGLRVHVDGVPCSLQRFVSGFRQRKNDTKLYSRHRNFMDRCRAAMVIWLWHKFFRLLGKMCTMRWGKIVSCGLSYHPYSYNELSLFRFKLSISHCVLSERTCSG